VYSHGAFGAYPAGSDSLESVENGGEFFGSSGNDVLIGNAKSNVMAGGNGNDTITGGPGTDTLLGDKGYSGIDQIHTFGNGPDAIDAFDGFEDSVDCGAGADSAKTDQFDQSLLSDCDTVDLRQADPFGIPPAPAPAPGPVETPGGGAQQPEVQPADNRAPRCTQSRLSAKKRAAFLRRGFALTLDCDEPARIEATATVAGKARASGLRPGDVVLGDKALDVAAAKRRVAFSVPHALRRRLGRRFTVSLRVDVIDRSGNATTSFTSFKVR
jgi:Ca2+-binding RTX toxin-like protein